MMIDMHFRKFFLATAVFAVATASCSGPGGNSPIVTPTRTSTPTPTPPPAGPFAYVSNGSANVFAYTISATTGALTPVAGSPFAAGTNPWGLAIDPSAKFAYVANNGSANVSAYTINATTGALTPMAGSPFAAGTNPIGVAVWSPRSIKSASSGSRQY